MLRLDSSGPLPNLDRLAARGRSLREAILGEVQYRNALP